jgi:hypothetical protein
MHYLTGVFSDKIGFDLSSWLFRLAGIIKADLCDFFEDFH